MSNAVREKYLQNKNNTSDYREKIIAYCEAQKRSHRTIDELLYQFYKLNDIDKLYKLNYIDKIYTYIIDSEVFDYIREQRFNEMWNYLKELRNINYESQNYDKTILCYKGLLQLFPNDSKSWVGMATCLQWQYKYDEAIQCVQKAIEINPSWMHLRKQIADIYMESGKFDEAEKYIQNLTEEFSQNPVMWQESAYHYTSYSQFNKAVRCLKTVEKLDPSNTEIKEDIELYNQQATLNPHAYLVIKANILDRLAQHDSASKQDAQAEQKYREVLIIYRKLAAIYPDAYCSEVAATLYLLAELHYSIKEYKQAEQEYAETVIIYRQLESQHPQTYLWALTLTLQNLGRLHYDTGNYSQAIACCKEAIEINPDYEAAYIDMAVLYEAMGNTQKAQEYRAKAELIYDKSN
jgi:tetratricopeptide (TPR) repeat protein